MNSEESKKICCVCNKECLDVVYEIDSHVFHPKCFHCSKCNTILKPTNLRFRNERLYCCNCYYLLFGKLCSVCKNYITDDTFVEAMDQYFHTDHFVCYFCKNLLKDKRFFKKEVLCDGEVRYRPFCADCHKFFKKIPCYFCQKSISGCRAFDGEHWYHVDCYLQLQPGDIQRDELTSIQEEVTESSELEKNDSHCDDKEILQLSLHLEEEKRQIEEEKKRLEMEKKEINKEKKRIEEEKNNLEKSKLLTNSDAQYNKSSMTNSVHSLLNDSYSLVHHDSDMNENESALETSVLSYSLKDHPTYVLSLPNDELPVYSYKELTTLPYPPDIDLRRREYHLSDSEFAIVFGMDKAQFETLPQWKRNELRKQRSLF